MKTFHQLTIALCVLSCAACSSDSGDESDLGTSTPIDASQAVSTDATGDDISVSNTEFDSVSTTDTASVTDTQSASDSLNEDTLPEPDPEVTPDVTVGPGTSSKARTRARLRLMPSLMPRLRSAKTQP